jgi:hypothetical protein
MHLNTSSLPIGKSSRYKDAKMIEQLCVIDTETGGLDPAVYSILSLGAVIWRAGQVVDTFEVFVSEPSISVEPDAMAINKIDLREIQGKGCPPALAVARFHDFLSRHFDRTNGKRITLAGHNVFLMSPSFAGSIVWPGSTFPPSTHTECSIRLALLSTLPLPVDCHSQKRVRRRFLPISTFNLKTQHAIRP